jgi:tRNA(adenine34) deaminase
MLNYTRPYLGGRDINSRSFQGAVWYATGEKSFGFSVKRGEKRLLERTSVVDHAHYMQQALNQAQAARDLDEVPVGAVIVREGVLLAAAHNERERLRDPTAHAEMIAITQAASALGSWRLDNCTLYVTLEPCPMCAGAIQQARLKQLVYGAEDPKAGAVSSLYRLLDDGRLNHQVELLGGVLAEPCGKILSDFFASKRLLGKK